MRTVDVGPERLARWFASFTERNGGAPTLEATGTGLRATAPNGTLAEATAPFAHSWWPDAATRRRRCRARHPRHARSVSCWSASAVSPPVSSSAPSWTEGKAGSRHVQGRSAAGGWSQQRFARRRAAQADAAFEAAADYAARILLPSVADLDALVLGGERRAVHAVLGDKRLDKLRAVARPSPGSSPSPTPNATSCWRHRRKPSARCASLITDPLSLTRHQMPAGPACQP